MRKFLMITAAFAAIGAAVAFIGTAAQAQPYGPGMMGGYGGYGYGMMGGYGPGDGPGYMMGPGYGPGYMMGPGYGRGYGRGYRRGNAYRGRRLCWNETDADRGTGYYAPCRR